MLYYSMSTLTMSLTFQTSKLMSVPLKCRALCSRLATFILLIQYNLLSENVFWLFLLRREPGLQHICSADDLEIRVTE